MKSFNDIRENTITEAVDYDKLKQLARYGLVDKSNVTKLIAAFKKMEDGKILQPAQRELMLNVLTDLTGIITGDSQMFMKAKKAVSEEVESITELTAEEKRLINTMYDKKGNLTDIGKKVMDHGKKNRFPHNTSASQGKMMSGKSTMYSEDTQIEEAVDKVAIQKQIDQTEKFMKSFTGNTSSVKMKKYALQTKLNKLKAQLAEEHFEIIQDGGKVELIDIQEAPAYTLMHNTFSGAVQEAIAVAKKQGFEIDEDDWSNKVATGPKKPSKDKTNSYTIDLMKGGKPAKKKLHMQVYNMGPKYELNCYVQ